MLDIIKHNVTFYSMKRSLQDEVDEYIREIDIDLLLLSSFWVNEPREDMKKDHMKFINAKLDKRLIFMDKDNG